MEPASRAGTPAGAPEVVHTRAGGQNIYKCDFNWSRNFLKFPNDSCVIDYILIEFLLEYLAWTKRIILVF